MMADMMDKTVLFLVVNGLDARALEVMWDCFGGLNASTRMASNIADEQICDSRSLLNTHSDMSFAEAAEDGFDVVVVPDGATADAIKNSFPGKTVLIRAMERGAAIVTVGEGARALIDADIVKGVKIAAPESLREPLEKAGAMYSSEPIVESDNFFSAQSDADMTKLCQMVSEYITTKREMVA